VQLAPSVLFSAGSGGVSGMADPFVAEVTDKVYNLK
jgi:hypothetical protein